MFNAHPIGHPIADAMKTGRLKVFDWIQVAAGDKIQARYDLLIRTSPTRFPLKVGLFVEYGVFYMPLRQLVMGNDGRRTPAALAQAVMDSAYGDANALAGIRDNTIQRNGGDPIEWELAGIGINGKEPVQEHVFNLYCDVYNEYFRNKQYHKTINTGRSRQQFQKHGTYNPGGTQNNLTTADEAQIMYDSREYSLFGKIINNREDLFTRPITAYTGANRNITLPTSRVLDYAKFEEGKVEFQRETTQEVNDRRYREYLRGTYGTSISEEADYRPRVIATGGFQISQFDIDSTQGETLGQMTGKSITQQGFGFPSRMFPEHGLIMVCMWARFPFMLRAAKQRLINANLTDMATFRELMADPAWMRTQPPTEWNVNDFIHSSNSAATGFSYAYGDSWRKEPARVHPWWSDRDFGYPVVNEDAAEARHLIECPVSTWDKVFKSEPLADIQIEGIADKTRFSMIPPAGESIYAGA